MPSPSAETAERWNRELTGFRFFFAHGGHANDGDCLTGRLRFMPGEAGLLDVFGRLELPLIRIPPGTRCQEDGQAHTAEEYNTLPRRIRDYPDYAQPGVTRIFAVPAILGVYREWLSIHVAGAHGNLWEVTDTDFQNALKLERIFASRELTFITP